MYHTLTIPRVLLHRFPRPDREQREAWIKFVQKNRNEEAWLPSGHTLICSDHFKKEDKCFTKTGRVYLKKCAVPFDISDSNPAVLSGAPFLEPKEEKAEPEPEACSSCTNTLAGFVYECVQCPQRVCGACGAAGAHGRHYVLRVPARSPRSEVELILDKVRSALELVVFKPSPRAKKKSDMADWASDESDTETDADDADDADAADDAAEQTVEVKMEFYEEEHDPFGAPTALAVKREWSPPAPSTSHTHSHEDMLQVAIKREPEDIEFEVGAARKRAHIAPPGKARPTNNDGTTTD